jgi:outer membrane protein assembly factor BamB
MRVSHLFSFALLPAAAAAQIPWPTFQGNARHDGSYAATLHPATFVQRWEVTVGPGMLNQVAVADGKVFASGPNRTLFVLDASTGSQLWSIAFPNAFSVNPPAYDGGRVYVQTGNHGNDTFLRCYNANTGALVFQAPHTAQWERYLAPTIVNGVAYVNGGYYGGMYAFNAVSGQQLWYQQGLPQYDEWTPAVEGNVAYAYVGGDLYACSTATGAIIYSIDDPGFSWAGWSMYLAPVLGGHNDAFIVHSGRLVRFDLLTHGVAWTLGPGYSGQPAVHNNVVYAIAGGALVARDQDSGASLWAWSDPASQLTGAIVVTQQHAIVRSATRTYVIDLNTHQSVWNIQRSGHISLGAGALYIASSSGVLTAVGFDALPTPTQLAPVSTHYTAPPVTVTVNGSGFTLGTGLQVLFGGTPASNVTIVDDQTLTCVVPVRGPGLVDVTVSNSLGQVSLPLAFAYTPALHTSGTHLPGGDIVLSSHQSPTDMLLAAWGIDPVAVTLPPFGGQLEIWPPTLMFVVVAWPTTFEVTLPIPAIPALSGTTIRFQNLVGPNVPAGLGHFSNSRTVVVQ